MEKHITRLMGLALGICLPAAASHISVSDGGFTFGMDSDSANSTSDNNASLLSPVDDSQYGEWWFAVINGTSYRLEDGISNPIGAGEAELLFEDVGGTPIDVLLNFSIADLGGGVGSIDYKATASNDSQITSLHEVSLISYFDYDLFGSSDDTGVVTGGNLMTITTPEGTVQVERSADSPSAWEVDQYSLLAANLDGGQTVLADTVTPFGPDDFTGAFQWDLGFIPSGGMAMAGGNVRITTTEAVPEPAEILLALTGLLAIGWARRRR